jgi:phosphatidate cytidylyltransferase
MSARAARASAPSATTKNPVTIRRVVAGLVLAAVGFACLILPWTFYLLVLAIALACLYELNHLCEVKGRPMEYPVAVIGVCLYAVFAALGLMHKWEGVLIAGIVVTAFAIGMYGEESGYFARTANTLLAVLYIGKLLTYFIFIRQINLYPGIGLLWTAYAIVLVALSDILAMLAGNAVGKHPMTSISPKKTWEGAVGSWMLVTAFAALIATIPQMHLLWWEGACIGALTNIAAQAGDLVESALKRDAGVKDAGSLIQGHGGVLDRFDSYLFGGTAFFATLHLIGILQVK